MAFDPKQFGATPITNPGFDPSAFGATPVNQISTQSPEAEQSPFILGTLAIPGQIATKAIGEIGINSPRQNIQNDILSMGRISESFLKLAHQETDPIKKREYLKQAQEALRGADQGFGMIQDLQQQIQQAQNIKTPFGNIPALSEEPKRAIQQIAGRAVKTVGAVGTEILGPTLSAGLFGAGGAIEEGKPASEVLKTAGEYALGGKIISAGLEKTVPFALQLLEKAPPIISKPITLAGKAISKGFEAITAQPSEPGTIGATIEAPLKKIGKFTEKAFSPSTYLNPLRQAGESLGLLRTPGEKLTIAEEKAKIQIRNALNPNVRQAKIEAKTNKNIEDIIVREGVPLDSYKESGKIKLDTTRARNMLSQKAEIENIAFNGILKDSGKYINFDKYAEDTYEAATAEFQGAQTEEAHNVLDKEFAAWKKQLEPFASTDADGRMIVPVDEFNKVKQYFWTRVKGFGTPDAILRNDVNYLAGHIAMKTIENKVDDVSIQSMNRYLGDLAYADSMLFSKQGSTVPGGVMGKNFARTIGGIVGSNFGFFGATTGILAADQLAEYLMKPEMNAGRTQQLISALRKKMGIEAPSLMEEAYQIIEQRATLRSRRLQLSGPGTPGTPENPHITPPYSGPHQEVSIQPAKEAFIKERANIAAQQAAERKAFLNNPPILSNKTLDLMKRKGLDLRIFEKGNAQRVVDIISPSTNKVKYKVKIGDQAIINELKNNIPNPKNPGVQQIIMELEASEAGKRNLIKESDGTVIKVSSSPSTFPEWIPSRLRSSILFKKIVEHLKNGNIPKRANTLETQLYDIVVKRIESKTEIDIENLF